MTDVGRTRGRGPDRADAASRLELARGVLRELQRRGIGGVGTGFGGAGAVRSDTAPTAAASTAVAAGAGADPAGPGDLHDGAVLGVAAAFDSRVGSGGGTGTGGGAGPDGATGLGGAVGFSGGAGLGGAGSGGTRLGGGAAREHVLPVAAPLTGLFPAGGLRRGGTVAVRPGPGATSLVLALLAEASADGAWTAVVGRPDLGLVAAAEAGVRLERLALVPHPGADLLAVTSALLDGLDVVVVAGARRAGVDAADRQRLAARARQRGAVLVAFGEWPGAEVRLACSGARWQGLGSGPRGGSGRLCSRRVRVLSHGRGAPTGRSAHVLLPGTGGAVGVPAGWSAAGPERGAGWPDEAEGGAAWPDEAGAGAGWSVEAG